MQHITRKELDRFSALFPSDEAEQKNIAAIIDQLDQAIEQTEAIIAKQQRIKTGLMQDLLTNGIDENGNIRSESTYEFKDSPLGRIPVEWDTTALSIVADVSAGITLGKAHDGPNTIELPYLRVANVQDGYLNLSDIKTIKLPLRDLEKYRLEVGDVLMNEGGDFDKLGRGTVWLGQIESCLHQNHVFKVRPNADKLLSNFLTAISASPYGKAFFMLASKQSTNLASINSTQLKAFLIPLPPLTEQKRICTLILKHQEVVIEMQNQLSKLKSLKIGLMLDLLTGKVRVTSTNNTTLPPESL
jgi:type I restriction enzyme S subunit